MLDPQLTAMAIIIAGGMIGAIIFVLMVLFAGAARDINNINEKE